MSPHGLPGSSLLTTLLGWIAMLMIGAVVIQILVAELVRWVTLLAPWILLTVVLGVVGLTVATHLRRRLQHF